MSTYLPRVGDHGFYSLASPFDNLQTSKLECIKVSRLSELSLGLDILNEVYIVSGLTQTEFDNDSIVDLQIALMVQPDGNEVYIPVSYFRSYVQSNIVQYKTEVLCVNIGAIPKELSTHHILEEMKIMASNLVGKELDAFIVEDEVSTLITEEEHIALENERLANVKMQDNPYQRISELEVRLEQLETYLSIFEDNVLENT